MNRFDIWIGINCYNYDKILAFMILDWMVEVVFSLERQNALISGAHDGMSDSLTSKGQSGHWGHDKCLAILNQRWEYVCKN